MMATYAMYTRMLIDIIGVGLIFAALYAAIYLCNRHNLELWIARAVMEANQMFYDKEHLNEKKEWVLTFIYDNGFAAWLPDDLVEYMVNDAFGINDLDVPNNVIEKFYTKKSKSM